MSRQVLLCVETNKKARTDYKYIDATIKRFYGYNRKIRYRPVFMESKTKYNAKDKEKEINKAIKDYPGETSVIYFIDIDDYERSNETKTLFDKIEDYCKNNGYHLVFFSRDVEDVYVGNSIKDDMKVKEAEEFTRNKRIYKIVEANLRSTTFKRHTSNILNVLDKFWK